MSIQLAFSAVGSGPPVIILHGLFGAGRNWAQIARALGHDYRCYLPDARNHGASAWAQSMSYPDMALDVLELMEREQLQQPILIGHSMGGKTAMTLALEHPRMIAGVAVIDIAPEGYGDQFSCYVKAMRGRDGVATTIPSLSTQALLCRPQDESGSASGGWQRCSLACRPHEEALLDGLVQHLRRDDESFDWRINLLATAVCMKDLCRFPPYLMHERFDGPALFVSGADSGYVRPESQANIRRLFPAARLEQIAGAAHWVHADQPEALSHALHRWLQEVSTPHTSLAMPVAMTN
jgi:esterase